ncbi:MAG: kelch motif-containing protein, partial [Thermoplasmata archaeon]|nr:kelch motif-containing protein [Thermoplasmata archaeon]
MTNRRRGGVPGRHVASSGWLAVAAVVVLLLSSGASAMSIHSAGPTGPARDAGANPARPTLHSARLAPIAGRPIGHPATEPRTGSASARTVGSTPAWSNLSGSLHVTPPFRSYGRSMAYDPVDGYVVMFGGYTGSYLDDTWIFQNGTWKEIYPKTSPDYRDHSTLAWDAADGY